MKVVLFYFYCFYIIFGHGYVDAAAFSDNTLIGYPLVEYTTATVGAEPYIYLLSDAGNLGMYNLGDGYFLGFQWASDISAVNYYVNFQLYSARSVGNLGTGTYELFAETGRITGTGATNEFYFPQAISMVGGYFYIMAIVQYGVLLPVHTQSCTAGNKVLGSSDSPPVVGGMVDFHTVYSNCMSFSVQAMYLSTTRAAFGCPMYIIKENTEKEWNYNRVSLSTRSHCWILRSAKEELNLEVEKQEFNIPCKTNLEIQGYEAGLQDTSERAAVCGNTEDIFDRWNSGAPYAYGSLTFSGSVGSASFKFTVRNTSEDGENSGGFPGWAIALIVIGCVVGIVMFCHCSKKKKEREARQKAEQERRAKEEREKREKEEKEQKDKNKTKGKNKVAPAPGTSGEQSTSGASAPPQGQPSSTQGSSSASGATAARGGTRGQDNNTGSRQNNDQTTVVIVEPRGNRLPPLPSGPLMPPPPSYDSVIAMDNQQGSRRYRDLQTADHGLTSTDIYGVPYAAVYKEP